VLYFRRVNSMVEKKENVFLKEALIHLLFILIAICFIYPILLLIGISFSDMGSIMKNGYRLIPEKFSLQAYRYVFASPKRLINGYLVTAFSTTVGTVTSLFVTSLLAYALSRQDYVFRKKISFVVIFTLLFNGGMVPWYMLISNYYKLKNTVWVLILPYLINSWNVIILRTFFQGIPKEMIEAADIDGSSEFRTFFSIIVPQSTPSLAAVGFLIMLRYWNDWYLSMLFIEKSNLHTLQYMIYNMMNKVREMMQDASAGNMSLEDMPTETVRMATVFLASGPVLFVFPFFQKYFVKGLTVGSVKG